MPRIFEPALFFQPIRRINRKEKRDRAKIALSLENTFVYVVLRLAEISFQHTLKATTVSCLVTIFADFNAPQMLILCGFRHKHISICPPVAHRIFLPTNDLRSAKFHCFFNLFARIS